MQGLIPDSKEQFKPVGYIKIGGKKEITKNGKIVTIPESYDYFVASGEHSRYFHEAFGEKPKSIEIMFCSDNPFESFWERYELWSGAKRYAFGDGHDFKVYDENKDAYIDMNKTDHKEVIETLHKKVGGEWSTLLSMTFMIPQTRIGGLWRLNTKGKASSIPAMKAEFKKTMQFAGRVSGIPFDLTIEKVTSHKPNSKNKFPVLNLTVNLSQAYMERVRDYIGNNFVGLLTESKIDDLSIDNVSKQVEYIPADES